MRRGGGGGGGVRVRGKISTPEPEEWGNVHFLAIQPTVLPHIVQS